MALHEVMKRDYKARSGIALGGIGAGSIELRKDGVFYNWTIFNNEPFALGTEFPWNVNSNLFFLIRFQQEGQPPQLKLLQVDDGNEVASIESHIYIYPYMTGVDEITYDASFPFARLQFSDAEMPVDVTLEAFSPFIPHDVKDSALPGVCFNFTVTAKTDTPVQVMLLGAFRNCVGYDVRDKVWRTQIIQEDGATTINHTAEMNPRWATAGSMALTSLGESSYYAGWEHTHPYSEVLLRQPVLPNIDDTDARNKRDEETGELLAMPRCFSSLAHSATLTQQGQSFDHTFLFTWHFPNLYALNPAAPQSTGEHPDDRLEGHYYATEFDDAVAGARYLRENLPELTARTKAFHDDFFDSTAPAFALNQIHSHLNTFHTSAWLTKDFNYGMIEGLLSIGRRGMLNCLDVGMYGSIAGNALFPELHQQMIRSHQRLQDEYGSMSHSADMNFTMRNMPVGTGGRLDLPCQYVVMALRGYFWTGDRAYLAEVWPSVQKALEFVLTYRDMNGDLLPDMEGIMCSYDNFPMHGVAAYVASQWLAAVASAADAAQVLGDDAAERRYREIVEQGRARFEDRLWNGSYYRLYNDEDGPHGEKSDACLTDQIVGQWAAHLVGLAPLFTPEHVTSALRAIVARNSRPYGLMNCSWPGDGYVHDLPADIWVDQGNTVWTGVELPFAAFLLYEGLVDEALQIIKNVDDRYRKAGMYFDHQEFGGHYYRPLGSWSILHGMLGLTINDQAYGFAPKLPGLEQKLFFAVSRGTGHYLRTQSDDTTTIALSIRSGALTAAQLTFELPDDALSLSNLKLAGRELSTAEYTATTSGKLLTLTFPSALTIAAGEALAMSLR